MSFRLSSSGEKRPGARCWAERQPMTAPMCILGIDLGRQRTNFGVVEVEGARLSNFFINHDLSVIRAMAHKVLVMKDGDVVEEGETLALFQAPQQAYTRELIAATDLA